VEEYGRALLNAWDDWRVQAEEYRELDEGRVLVLERHRGRFARAARQVWSGSTRRAQVFFIRAGKVTKLIAYRDRESALANLGLASEGDTS
jgi:hypothetical protein